MPPIPLKEIKKDITYFRTSYKRANLQVDISGMDQDQAAHKVKEPVEELDRKVMQIKIQSGDSDARL